MQDDKRAIEHVIDEVWSSALRKIMKGQASGVLRPNLGDEIDLFVPQAATATLIRANPAFASVLYSSAYTSAKRNAYLIIRRLGMPADFFWKFDCWTQERAFETLQKVLARVFATLFSKHKEGTLSLLSVDMEHGRYEVSFGDCAECSGLKTDRPICFFHAGIFAGVFGSLLDRDLDAVETECASLGAAACKFKVGKPDDREIMIPLDQRFSQTNVNVDMRTRAQATLQHQTVRTIGNLVGIGYYQLLLASSFLTNIEVLSHACFNTGEELGQELALMLPAQYQGDAARIVAAFCRDLRHLDVRITDRGQEVEVKVVEAPEAVGPLAREALVPFICGEMQSLLSALMKRPLRFQSERRDGEALLIRFAP